MKKLVYYLKVALIVLISALCTSCGESVTERIDSDGKPIITYHYEIGANDIFSNGDAKVESILKFQYNGHNYIQFNIAASYGGKAGIVHDPECLLKDLQDTTKHE